MNIVLGMVGAAIASWVFSLVGVEFGGWLGYLIAGFIGAAIIIFIWWAWMWPWMCISNSCISGSEPGSRLCAVWAARCGVDGRP